MSGESLKQNIHNVAEKDSETRQKGLQGQLQNPDQRKLDKSKIEQQKVLLNKQSRTIIKDDTNKEAPTSNLKMEIPVVLPQSFNSQQMSKEVSMLQLQDNRKQTDLNAQQRSPSDGKSKRVIEKIEFQKHHTIGATVEENFERKKQKLVPSLIFEDLESNNPLPQQQARKIIQNPKIIINSENTEREEGNQIINKDIDRLKLLNQRFNQIPSERNLPLNKNIDFNSDQSRLTDRLVVGTMSQIPSNYLLNSQHSQQPFEILDASKIVQGDQKHQSKTTAKIDQRYQEKLIAEGSYIGNSQMSIMSGIKDSAYQNDSCNPLIMNTVKQQT